MRKFIIDLMLFFIAYILTPIVETLTLIVVGFKYKSGALEYFDDVGYKFDLQSAGRHRTLWNFLFIKKNGFKFYKHTDTNEKRTISRILGINEWLGQLTLFGILIKNVLWVIDYPYWFSGGHCFQSMKANDFELPEAILFLDGTLMYKEKYYARNKNI